MEVSVRQGSGVYVPASFGGREVVWQEPVSVITTHTGARIRIEGTRSELITSHGAFNVSDDVPAMLRDDHESILAFWQAQAEGWAADAAALSDVVLTDTGELVTAPGFQSGEQFQAFVSRAKRAGLRTWPARAGVVMVSSSRDDARYAVTRTSCTCRGHQSHGRCMHRALALWLADVEGVPVGSVPTIGADAAGVTMAPGPIPAAKAA